jgi:hypothetical protein
MTIHGSRLRLVTLGACGMLLAAAVAVDAQVKCYLKKCVEYPDGTRVCERIPIDCGTIEIQ